MSEPEVTLLYRLCEAAPVGKQPGKLAQCPLVAGQVQDSRLLHKLQKKQQSPLASEGIRNLNPEPEILDPKP